MHKIVAGSEGKMHVIGEQYKIKTNAVGTFFHIIGFGNSRSTAKVGNMAVYTLAPDHQLEKIDLFEKDRSVVKIFGDARKYTNGRLDQALVLRGISITCSRRKTVG